MSIFDKLRNGDHPVSDGISVNLTALRDLEVSLPTGISVGGAIAVLSALFTPINPAFTQKVAACELPPNLVFPLETGPFIVGTYHTTGVPGSDRVIQVLWPRDIESPLSGLSVVR